MATPEIPLHRRSLTYDTYRDGDDLVVTARLRDERQARPGDAEPTVVHDLELDITVRLGDLVITRAAAHMHTFPHVECSEIESAFTGLEGLSVARGFTRAVQERFAGRNGCSHLDQLARGLGPAVIQASISARAQAASNRAPATSDGFDPSFRTFMRDTCHLWREGGPAEQKIELGWRGDRPRPVLSVAALRAEVEAERDGADHSSTTAVGEGPGGSS